MQFPNNQFQPIIPQPMPGKGKAAASLILGLISFLSVCVAAYFLFNPDKLYPDNPFYNEVDTAKTMTKIIIALIISVICAIIGIVQSVSAKRMGYFGGMVTAGKFFSILSIVIIVIGIALICFFIGKIVMFANQASSLL